MCPRTADLQPFVRTFERTVSIYSFLDVSAAPLLHRYTCTELQLPHFSDKVFCFWQTKYFGPLRKWRQFSSIREFHFKVIRNGTF